jgi:hypothetical protein
MFMFVEVPDPVWKTSTGNWSRCSPDATVSAAAAIASATSPPTTPSSALTAAASPLIIASALIRAASTRWPEIGKFSTARWVCAPHSAAAGTRTSPIESCSTRYSSPPAPVCSLTGSLLLDLALPLAAEP